jgi:hypothetical protein
VLSIASEGRKDTSDNQNWQDFNTFEGTKTLLQSSLPLKLSSNFPLFEKRKCPISFSQESVIGRQPEPDEANSHPLTKLLENVILILSSTPHISLISGVLLPGFRLKLT